MIVHYYDAQMTSSMTANITYLIENKISGNVATMVFEPGFQILHEIETGGQVFRLSRPIDVHVSIEDGLWINQSHDLSILAAGESKAEALRSFCEDFAVLWEQIATAPDDSLTPDAIKVKAAFHRSVESATPIQ
ncbi:MAG: hypothetical protein ABSG79_07125 [Bryobacteraceae bacterium]|jgi:hypothetical protein